MLKGLLIDTASGCTQAKHTMVCINKCISASLQNCFHTVVFFLFFVFFVMLFSVVP